MSFLPWHPFPRLKLLTLSGDKFGLWELSALGGAPARKGVVNGFQVDARFGGFFLHVESLKNHGFKVKMYYIIKCLISDNLEVPPVEETTQRGF